MTDGSAAGTMFERSFDDPYLTSWPVFSAPFTRPQDIHSAAAAPTHHLLRFSNILPLHCMHDLSTDETTNSFWDVLIYSQNRIDSTVSGKYLTRAWKGKKLPHIWLHNYNSEPLQSGDIYGTTPTTDKVNTKKTTYMLLHHLPWNYIYVATKRLKTDKFWLTNEHHTNFTIYEVIMITWHC